MNTPSTNRIATTEPAVEVLDAAAVTPPARAAKFFEWFRRGLMVVTVIAFLYVAYGYVRLFSEWRQAAEPSTAPTEASFELTPLAGVLPLDGPWTFADLEWNLRSSLQTSEQVDSHLRAVMAPPTGDVSGYPDASADLVDLVASLQLQPMERDGCELYSIDRTTLKAQLLVRKVEGHTKAIAFAGAYPCGDARWQMFELTPRAAAAKSTHVDAHLLPLPAGARRQGGRFADDGRLLLELVTLETTTDALVAAWKTEGWEVRPSGFGNGEGFSYLCRRGDDVIYAWSASPPEKLQNIMLVNSPTTAELEAQKLSPND